jgi:hypothetical protein
VSTRDADVVRNLPVWAIVITVTGDGLRLHLLTQAACAGSLRGVGRSQGYLLCY